MRSSILAIATLVPLLASCGTSGPAYDEGVPAGVAAVVDMTSTFAFSPASVTVAAGDTVEWRNTAVMKHTVTADPKLANDPAHVSLPDGAETFNSGDVPPGQIYRHTFDVPGQYDYVCLPHEFLGMLGTVFVTPAG